MKKNPRIIPDTYSYNLVIQSKLIPFSKSKSNKKISSISSSSIDKNLNSSVEPPPSENENKSIMPLDECYSLLESMKKGKKKSKPNIYTYNLVLNGITCLLNKNELSALSSKCLSLFDEIKSYKRIIKPDAFTYSTIMKLHLINLQNGEPESMDKLISLIDEMKDYFAPTSLHYNFVLKGLTFQMEGGNKSALKNALAIFEQMKSSADPVARPDLVNYKTLFSGIYKLMLAGDPDGSIANIALNLFDELKIEALGNSNLKPDLSITNIILQILVHRAGEKDVVAAEKCLEIFDDMRANPQSVKPNTISYNIALNALSKSARTGDIFSVDRCLLIIQEMEESKKNQPTIISFCTAMKVLTKAAISKRNDYAYQKCLTFYANIQTKIQKNQMTIPDTLMIKMLQKR